MSILSKFHSEKLSYPSQDCNKGTLLSLSPPPPIELTCEKLLDVDFRFSPLPRQMTCEISVKTHTVFFFLVFSLYLFINWCPSLKARDPWFVYLPYCLGIYSHSACLNGHSWKPLLCLAACSPCSLQVREQHCERLCTARGKIPLCSSFSSPPGVFLLLMHCQRIVFQRSRDGLKCQLCHSKGRRDLHVTESTAKSCVKTCNRCQGSLTPSPWSFCENTSNFKLLKRSRKGGREENPIIKAGCLEKITNMLIHFYSLGLFTMSFLCNTTLGAPVKILIFCLWELSHTCASCILFLYAINPCAPGFKTKLAIEVLKIKTVNTHQQ